LEKLTEPVFSSSRDNRLSKLPEEFPRPAGFPRLRLRQPAYARKLFLYSH
jgi:hypothetical protein